MKSDFRNHTSALVFSCKFAGDFQNDFSKEHLWRAASEDTQKMLSGVQKRATSQNFVVFTEKRLQWSLVFTKVTDLDLQLKNRAL